MLKAKHAYGALERVDENIKSGIIDSYDVLFVKDSDGKPYVGWVSKDGQKEIVDPYSEVSKLETQLESELATKANVTEVDEKINMAVTDTVASAKAYTDGKVEAAISEHMVKKYEVTDVPAGTLIKMNENEIRIMCPSDTVWKKQAVGANGDPNTYYVTLKTYVYDDNVVGYVEHIGDMVDSEILKDLKTDEYGRRYQPTWLGVAKYDESTSSWTYYGANSTVNHYIGWDYQLDLYDANGVMVASDSIRINLSNENCYSSIEPYYIGEVMKEVDTKIEEKIREVESSYEIIEF